jgi:molybdopterin/thiamine biosynthesis adenylyltransferase
MEYSITFLEKDYTDLLQHLFTDRQKERAAYLLCRISSTSMEDRLLVREIIRVKDEDVEESSETHMKIRSRSFMSAMKRADITKQLFVFVHSHPDGLVNHSKKDDFEEKQLFQTAYIRIKTSGVHASLVLSSPDKPVGRAWLADGTTKSMTVIRVIGERFRFYYNEEESAQIPDFFDRQVRAFGNDIQKLLGKLHIAIVGSGGTGSAICEELIRLGVGTLTVIDGQRFEKSNVNRVYGSHTTDEGEKKVALMERLASEIGLGTKINSVDRPISFESAVKKLKNSDIIFGCTDDQWGRSILVRGAVYYGIPVFDMGVKIDSKDGIIKSIEGRVTTLLGEYACLFCRQRITEKAVYEQSLAELDPEQLKKLIKQGYADELATPSPSVISFTSGTASLAINEMLHRLTGFMGSDRVSNEILIFFDQARIRSNRQFSKADCFCGDKNIIMRGDVTPLLDLVWRPE